MKHMKKLVAMIIAMTMVLAMAVSVSAADKVYTVAQPSDEDVITGHTYKAYQILKANSLSDGGQFIGIAWADNVTAAGKTALLNGAEDIDAMIEALGTDDDSAKANAFAKLAYENKDALGSGTAITSGTTVLGLGYWLIVDETTAEVAVINRYTLFVSDGETAVKVVSKVEAPKSDKKIKDINDSETADYTDWQDSADHDVGDKIPFRITATLPSDYTDYQTYFLTFHDKEGGGLKFDASTVKVYLDEADESKLIDAENYDLKTSGLTDGCTFEVNFTYEQLTTIGVTNKSVIIVEYESELTAENVVYGQKGNPNTSWITYNNNPNTAQGGEGKTPEDTVIAFTYKTVVNKTDKSGTPLPKADFNLYKKVQPGTADAQLGSAIKAGFSAEIAAKAGALEDGTSYILIDRKDGEAPTATTFTYSGIDDGTYVIVETVVPDGYNGADAITLEVKATHTEKDVNIDPATGKVDGTETFVLTELDGGTGFTTVVADGTFTTNVPNKQGATLPETGGIGTTIFYVIGAVLVIGAGIVLVTRRRMSAQ